MNSSCLCSWKNDMMLSGCSHCLFLFNYSETSAHHVELKSSRQTITILDHKITVYSELEVTKNGLQVPLLTMQRTPKITPSAR